MATEEPYHIPLHMSRLWLLDMAWTITNSTQDAVTLAKYSYSPSPYAIQLPFLLADYCHPVITFFFLIGLLPVRTWPGVRHILEGAWTHKPTRAQTDHTDHDYFTPTAHTQPSHWAKRIIWSGPQITVRCPGSFSDWLEIESQSCPWLTKKTYSNFTELFA